MSGEDPALEGDRGSGAAGAAIGEATEQLSPLTPLGQCHDPIQGGGLLLQQRSAVELPAKVPVGGVQEAHRQKLARRTVTPLNDVAE